MARRPDGSNDALRGLVLAVCEFAAGFHAEFLGRVRRGTSDGDETADRGVSEPSTSVNCGAGGDAGGMEAEQWEHMLVQATSGSEAIQTVPSKYQDALGNARGGWNGLFGVLDHLGTDGWQLVQVENVNADGTSGRLWLKKRAKMARVARAGDDVH